MLEMLHTPHYDLCLFGFASLNHTFNNSDKRRTTVGDDWQIKNWYDTEGSGRV